MSRNHYRQAETILRALEPSLAEDVYREWLAWLNRLKKRVDMQNGEAGQ